MSVATLKSSTRNQILRNERYLLFLAHLSHDLLDRDRDIWSEKSSPRTLSISEIPTATRIFVLVDERAERRESTSKSCSKILSTFQNFWNTFYLTRLRVQFGLGTSLTEKESDDDGVECNSYRMQTHHTQLLSEFMKAIKNRSTFGRRVEIFSDF